MPKFTNFKRLSNKNSGSKTQKMPYKPKAVQLLTINDKNPRINV